MEFMEPLVMLGTLVVALMAVWLGMFDVPAPKQVQQRDYLANPVPMGHWMHQD